MKCLSLMIFGMLPGMITLVAADLNIEDLNVRHSIPELLQPVSSADSEQQPVNRLLLASPTGRYSARNANYDIHVRLDPDTHMLEGRELLTWRNDSGRATSELQFHLYYNAWKNTKSTWMREYLLARGEAFLSRPPEDWGWITVTKIELPATENTAAINLTSAARYIAPDDDNKDDETVLSVQLPDQVEPGETLQVEIEWKSKIPRTFSRTGVVGDFFFIAQWFPKIGVLETSGWNCHQFHVGTEFYADYGVYDVRVTVPKGWIVGATGVRQRLENNSDGTSTHQYVQKDVHDFAWTTSPNFIERIERFEHESLPDVEMRLLLQPEHEGQAERHFKATRTTLTRYGEWFGAYPYTQLTIVDPAWQSGAGGMEYPTLFTAGTSWLAPSKVTRPEGVTIHEAGHQFWHGLIGNNEFEYAWLDEGLNTFSTAKAIEAEGLPNYHSARYFGGFLPYVFNDIPRSRATDGNRLSGYRAAARSDAQSTPTFQYWPGTGGAISYNKTALWLHTLERHLGWENVQKILSTFFSEFKFRHPLPQDFFATANEVANVDLDWFFDQVHRSSNVFDYGIQQIGSRPQGSRGFSGDQEPIFTDRRDNEQFQTDVVVRRYGEAIFPVDILVTFTNGEEVRETWDGVARWKLFTYQRAAQILQAEVDPDSVLLLDLNRTNNSKTMKPMTNIATTKWMLKWMTWLQDVMLTYAFFV